MPPGPQQPNGFPWSGKIIPWSAALRSGPTAGARTIADLPRGENVKVVLRSGGWLYVESRLESRSPLKGYVSRELIKHVQPTNTARSDVQQNVKADVTPQHIGSRFQQKQTLSRDTSVSFQLAQPRIIAIATDSYLKPTIYVADPLLPGKHVLGFGQDFSFARGRTQPHGPSIGTTTAALDGKMRLLLKEFASNDTRGKARRLFDAFLKPQRTPVFWSDTGLTADAEAHPNITTFVHRALSAPNSPERTEGQTRIHQALEKAGWDINAAALSTGLGVPAFNQGSPAWHTGDFTNGLGVMINGIQHAIVVAKEYHLDRARNEYYIKLEYVFYDVFGLDDDDLKEYGADGGWIDSDAAQGITAWWQLQHQHGYAPLITRIAFEREFRVSVPPARGTRR
ncbi:SH3 domain-containing protein [Cystobacter fuscus]|uniref:SH3 domain-containing protein n=1 Tax=Cystobacter fuscus TaxID=43 RepID=UPI0037BEA741